MASNAPRKNQDLSNAQQKELHAYARDYAGPAQRKETEMLEQEVQEQNVASKLWGFLKSLPSAIREVLSWP